MRTLSEIFEPIDRDMERFGEVFSSLLKSHVRVINIIARHLVRKRGKGVRPALVLLTARLCGEPDERTYKSAALIEMLHNATLIHDDVVDESKLRRGVPTINSIWKNKTAVLMGDYVLARSLTTAAGLNDLRVIAYLSEASARMSQGEINQMVKSRKRDITEEEYFQIIGDKTAALISASCRLGAVSVGADDETVARMGRFGEQLGLAFQIKDDLLDFQGSERLFGKQRGADLREGKITLPLIRALQNAGNSSRRSIYKRIKKGATHDDIREVVAFMHENGGIRYAEEKARELVQSACGLLEEFRDSPCKRSLLDLAYFFIDRKK